MMEKKERTTVGTNGNKGAGLELSCELCSVYLNVGYAFILFFNISFLKFYLFYLIYFWLCWVFIAEHGLSLVAASGGYSSLRCTGFSLRWLLLLRSTGSRHVGFSSCGSQALERRLSSCGARA